MADLAQALVSLSSASRGRSSARKALLESAAIVARAAVQYLRAGDQVSLPSISPYSSQTRYSVEKLGWKLLGSSQIDTAKVLCRNGAPLHDERCEYAGNYIDQEVEPDDDNYEIDPPQAPNLIAFSEEAPAVIAAFIELMDNDEREFGVSARKLAALRPTTGAKQRAEGRDNA